MFSESCLPLPWDKENAYTRENIELYFEVLCPSCHSLISLLSEGYSNKLVGYILNLFGCFGCIGKVGLHIIILSVSKLLRLDQVHAGTPMNFAIS